MKIFQNKKTESLERLPANHFMSPKLVICNILLILIFLLMGSSNNNPSTYMERIFKPINMDNGTFHYSTIIVIIVIYNCLKNINDEKKNYFINSFFSRMIVVAILINGFIWINTYTTKFYKSFHHNLNSIYMDRDKTSVEFDFEENKLSLNGKISLINCSDEAQEFSLKIKSPSLIKNHINEDYVVLKNKIKIHPKEERNLYIDEDFEFNTKDEGTSYSSEAFEYVLFNEDGESVFKGSVNDYNVDKMDLNH